MHQIGCTQEIKELFEAEIQHFKNLNKQEEIVILGEDSIKSDVISEAEDDIVSDISSIESDEESKETEEQFKPIIGTFGISNETS